MQVVEASLGALVSAIETAGGRVLSVQPLRQSLEEYFFKEMGGEKSASTWDMPA